MCATRDDGQDLDGGFAGVSAAVSGSRAERLERALAERFAPATVAVVDRSASHAGHAGAAPGGETHFDVVVTSPVFRGQSRVARSRAVHDAAAAEFAGGLHALSLRLLTPEEAAAS